MMTLVVPARVIGAIVLLFCGGRFSYAAVPPCTSTDANATDPCMCRSINSTTAKDYCGVQPNNMHYSFRNDSLVEEISQTLALTALLVQGIADNSSDATCDGCITAILGLVCDLVFPPCADAAGKEPMLVCLEDCNKIFAQCNLWNEMVDLIFTSEKIYSNPSAQKNPLDFIKENVPLNCSLAQLTRIRGLNVTDVNNDSCLRAELINNCTVDDPGGTESSLNIINEVVIPAAAALAALSLLVVLSIFFLLCCCKLRKRKLSESEDDIRKMSCRSAEGDEDNNRVLAILPFIPSGRQSKIKTKADLFEMVPSKFMEVVSAHQSQLVQWSKVNTTVFLAEGFYSEVYQGVVTNLAPKAASTVRDVAIKNFKEDVHLEDQVSYLSLLLKISTLQHSNVIQLIGLTFGPTARLSIIYPSMAKNDLLTYLKKKKNYLFSQTKSSMAPDFLASQLLDIVMMIFKGVTALNQHLNGPYKMLSAHTCLVDLGDRVVVGDVCISMVMKLAGHGSGDACFQWMSPEVLKAEEFSEKSDVWSFGVTCWEVFTLGAQPYNGVATENFLELIDGGYRLARPPLCPKILYPLLLDCWRGNPDDRPSFSALNQRLDQLLPSAELDQQLKEINEQLRKGHQVKAISEFCDRKVCPSGHSPVAIGNKFRTRTYTNINNSHSTPVHVQRVGNKWRERPITETEEECTYMSMYQEIDGKYLDLVGDSDLEEDDVAYNYVNPKSLTPRDGHSHLLEVGHRKPLEHTYADTEGARVSFTINASNSDFEESEIYVNASLGPPEGNQKPLAKGPEKRTEKSRPKSAEVKTSSSGFKAEDYYNTRDWIGLSSVKKKPNISPKPNLKAAAK